MNMYTSTKKSKKFILILVLLILFSFCYPKDVKATIELEDFPAIPAQIFYMAEKGILKYLNNLFTNDEHHTSITTENEDYEAESYSVYLTPENIIKGKFILFDANIFRDIQNSDKYYDDGALGGTINSGKESLRNVIAGWYYALRNFAIVALLSVLVYVGIRMILSTVAQDKAKYKVMFKDWLVALCLVVIMHYIMIGILNISSMITDALGDGQNTNTIGKLTERISGVLSESSSTNADGGADWFDRHYQYKDDEGTYDLGDAYAFILVLGGIIIYTFIFAVKYLKREFTIIFLILLGPISCITYPIDKISDGKAQAFNKWLTELIYQVIIQPFHLLLYIVLVGSAVELANKNVIYALVCFAVMIPAEKFIKSMFGFKDQLSSPLGAIASTALASKALHAIMGKGKGSSDSGGKDGDSDNDSVPNELPPRTVDKPGLVDGNAENSEEDNTERETTRRQENRNFESEEPEESDSASDVYQNSDDSTTDAERDTSGVQMDDEQDSQKSEDESEQNSQADHDGNGTESEQTQGPNTLKGWAKDKINKLDNTKAMKIHNQRVSKKHGSTNRKQRWKRRIVKGTKAGAKGLLKGGAIGLVGAAAMAGALLTGNGKEALGIAGGIAAYTGKKVWNGGKNKIKGATGAVKDYFNAYRDDMTGKIPFVKSKEEKALEDFKADKKYQERAVRIYRKNHGEDPSYEDLEKEMEDMFALSRYNLTDDQIDNAIGSFQKLKEEGLSETDALNETVYATKLADDYSKKDFRTEKTMKEAINTIANDFEKYGVPREVAEAKAEKYLRQAAEIKGTEIALPPRKIPESFAQQMLRARGVSKPSKLEINQEEQLHVSLKDSGFDESQIRQLSELSANTGDDFKIIVNKAVKVHADWQKGKIPNIDEIIGRNAGTKAANQEIIERMKVENLGISEEKDISDIRRIEMERYKGDAKKIQQGREYAQKLMAGDVSKEDKSKATDNDQFLASQYKKRAK